MRSTLGRLGSRWYLGSGGLHRCRLGHRRLRRYRLHRRGLGRRRLGLLCL